MAGRAAVLAAQFEQAVTAFEATIAALTDEQWQVHCPNEGRSVGVVGRNVAAAIPFEMGVFRAIAAGHPTSTINLHDLAAMNAASAARWADCTKDETLALLRDHAAAAAAEVRRWDDQQLARVGRYIDEEREPWTTEEWVERVLIGHICGHLRSIRAALGSA